MSSPKGKRRYAREDAVQILYQIEMNHGLTPIAAIQSFELYFSGDIKIVDEFTRRLVQGVAHNLAEIDKRIEEASDNWKPERMAAVDRNILRIGVFELCHCDDIPATVSINEMVEVAKGFGSENSASFVNGILDKVRLQYPSPQKVT
jgi:transcription antitermination protein NusB